MPIEITLWGHSAVRLERDGARLVIDPGGYSDQGVLAGADAVLVTHEHADHVVVGELAPLVEDGLFDVWAPGSVVQRLSAEGAPAQRLHAVVQGDEFEAAGFGVHTLGRDHAVIHPRIPVAENRAFWIENLLLHPGDSLTPQPDGASVEVLFLPVAAPWLKLGEAIDYLGAVSPHLAVPIHDAILSDTGKGLVDGVLGGLAGDTYRRLAPGEPLGVGA